MYKCDECGNVSDTLERKSELVIAEPYYPSVYHEEDVCPNCGHDGWVTVEWCKNCEDEVTEETYCDTCLTATRYHLNRCIAGIMADTLGTQEEVIEMLKEIIKEKE